MHKDISEMGEGRKIPRGRHAKPPNSGKPPGESKCPDASSAALLQERALMINPIRSAQREKSLIPSDNTCTGAGDVGSRPSPLAGAAGSPPPLQPTKTAFSDAADEPVVLVTLYKNGRLRKEFMAWKRAQRLSADGFDLFIDMIRNRVEVRRRNGKRLVHERGVRGIGNKVFALLPKLLRMPGFFRTPAELGAMKPEIPSHSECAETYVCRIRKIIFAESDQTQYFILSRPGPTYAFNSERSFCQIERLS